MIYIKIIIIVFTIFFVVLSTLLKNKNNEESIIIPENKNRSKSEKLVAQEFTKIIEEYGGNRKNIQHNKRPKFLRNPETGRCLELDMYYEDDRIKLAVEYNGIQHIKFPNHFHKDDELGRENFDALQRRDRLKRRLCVQNDVHLITIPYTCDTCDYRNGQYVYNSKIPLNEKKERIREYLIPRINRCLIENQT